MKHLGKKPRKKPSPAAPPEEPGTSEAAFDVFLRRGLQKIYGDIANEPVPDALMDILKDGGRKKEGGGE